MSGFNFTRCTRSEDKMSKLDRFLASEGVVDRFSDLVDIALDRTISDHKPIGLKNGNVYYEPSPFKFSDFWLELKGFDEVVRDFWSNFQRDIFANHFIYFKDKINFLKSRIRDWLRVFNLAAKNEKQVTKKSLCEIDKLLDIGFGSQ